MGKSFVQGKNILRLSTHKQKNKVMYVGVTNNLLRRIYEHKCHLIEGFTKKNNVTQLVYFEETNDINAALRREKKVKKWRREKKNNLVSTVNPEWQDLNKDWYEVSPNSLNDKE